MGYGLWVMVTISLQTNLGNPKRYVLQESMGYTWYLLGGSLLYIVRCWLHSIFVSFLLGLLSRLFILLY
jgi:hypothetical protein